MFRCKELTLGVHSSKIDINKLKNRRISIFIQAFFITFIRILIKLFINLF